MIQSFLSTYIPILFILICLVITSIDGRRSLQNYVVQHDYSSSLRRDQLSVYDEWEQTLLCLTNSSLEYSFNRMTNLVLYPSYQSIASINSLWFSSPYQFQANLNVLDDKLNRWTNGKIYERRRSQALQLVIEYQGNVYVVENKYGSFITEIRDEKRPSFVLTRFYQTTTNLTSPFLRHRVQVYSNVLPHPTYIMALYSLDSLKFKRRL